MKRLLPFAVMLVAAACSDLAAPLAPPTESAAASMTSNAAAAKAAKVDVCHVNGTGSYQLLNINGNALPAHLGHGDLLPGAGVLGADCKAAVAFSFISAGASGGYIVWTVGGTTEPVTYEIEEQLPAPPGSPLPPGWNSVQTVVGTGTGTFSSGTTSYAAGKTYHIKATLSDNTVVYSAEFSS